MNQEFIQSVKELDYAALEKRQEERLRDLEKQFNEEFNTDYYLMAMTREDRQ